MESTMLHVYSQYSRIVDFVKLPDPTNDWRITELIGEGTYGEVYRGVNRHSGKEVAVKVLECVHEVIDEIEKEFVVLDQLSYHQNIPSFYGLYLKVEPHFDDQIWLIMELCDGGSVTDLSKYLQSTGQFMDELLIAHILKETLLVLKHLHDYNVIHRDVKGHNILLTKSGDIRLIDFGVSGHLRHLNDKKNTSVGTPYWMAPEVIACEQQPEYLYDLRCDIWSLGITAIELADSRPPLSDLHPMRALFRIPRNPPPTFSDQKLWSPEFKAFVARCLKKDYEERPFCNDLLTDPFIRQVPNDTFELHQQLASLIQRAPQKINEPDITTKHGRLKSRRKSPKYPSYVGDDLTLLETLTEDVVVSELYTRYLNGHIYTYIGDILLALNPFKTLSIYSKSYADQYYYAAKADNPPHIFALADLSYQAMVQQKLNQCIVISGESGAGKTESANLLVQQLTHVGRATSRSLADKILQVNPLMEAFGNAKTILNDNSSRFGKYLEMIFSSSGKILGAKMTEYLLEKSRVVHQSSGEHNFHIFYYVHDGITDDDLRSYLHLVKCRSFRYLNYYGRSTEDTCPFDNKKMFNAIQHCFDIIGFKAQDVNHVYAILAAILHMGNIELVRTDAGTLGDSCSISNYSTVEAVSRLLGIDSKDLVEALTKSGIVTRGEIILRMNTLGEAISARDGMAKALYGRIFNWIVNKINVLLKPPKQPKDSESHMCVGLLDIFGFENFGRNSFEQLCINIANEQIQFHFNEHIFAWEMQEYANEGIEGNSINYVDNRPILDMFLSKPLGLLALLDEESNFPKSSDNTLMDKFHHNIMSPHFIRCKGNNLNFAIEHYAGRVDYEASGFLKKNRDRLPIEIVSLLRMSDKHLIRLLFHNPLNKTGNVAYGSSGSSKASSSHASEFSSPIGSVDLHPHTPSSSGRSPYSSGSASASRSQQTVATYFRFSLMDLLAKMVSGTPHFVRCIKPNNDKKAGVFNFARVMTQLRYTGVLETTRIRRQGHSHRLTFADFISRYYLLAYRWRDRPVVSSNSCQQLLHKLELTNWKIGRTKVFLKYYHVEELDRKFSAYQRKVVLSQAAVRGVLCRMHYVEMKSSRIRAAITIQKCIRRLIALRTYRPVIEARRKSAIKIQSLYRGYLTRKVLRAWHSLQRFCAVKIQTAWRGHRTRREARRWGEMRRRECAAAVIQIFYRKYLKKKIRKHFMQLKKLQQIMERRKENKKPIKKPSFESRWMLPAQHLRYYNKILQMTIETPASRIGSKMVIPLGHRQYYDSVANRMTDIASLQHSSRDGYLEDEASRLILAKSAATAILANKPRPSWSNDDNNIPWDAPLASKLKTFSSSQKSASSTEAAKVHMKHRALMCGDESINNMAKKMKSEMVNSYLALWAMPERVGDKEDECEDDDGIAPYDDYYDDGYNGTSADRSMMTYEYDALMPPASDLFICQSSSTPTTFSRDAERLKSEILTDNENPGQTDFRSILRKTNIDLREPMRKSKNPEMTQIDFRHVLRRRIDKPFLSESL